MQNTNEEPIDANTSAQLNKLNADPSFSAANTAVAMSNSDAPDTVVAVPIAHNYIAIEKRSHNLRVPVVESILVLLGLLIAALVYYFVIRVPDTEYAKASSIVDAMATNAKKMAEIGKKFFDLTAVTGNNVDEEKSELTQYKIMLNQLQQSPVIKRDGDVKAAYEVNKKRIEDYAASTTTFIDTASVYANLYKVCSDDFKDIDSVRTLAEYDAAVKTCLDYASSHTSVPDKNFNDNFYVHYRDATLDYVSSIRQYFQAIIDHDSQSDVESALTRVENAHNETTNAGAGKNIKLENTLNPTDQLNNLKSMIDQRKSVLLR
jgi:hypothetical protein